MDNKRKHTVINDDDDENHIEKKLKPLIVEEISHDDNEYAAANSAEFVTRYDERPVAPLEDFASNEYDGCFENVMAWNCNPAIPYAYRWSNEERAVQGDGIVIIIDLTMNDDTITITSSKSKSSTVITSSSQQVEYVFDINVDDSDSDDSYDSDDSEDSNDSGYSSLYIFSV